MASEKHWNVNRYFDETETEAQWELRKTFLLTHKGKYPKSRLVCLARTFANIQFLGCRYNDDLMELIENLAKEIPAVIDYRKKQKSKLQSMFVMASDVAAKTVKNEKLRPMHHFINPTERFDDDLPAPPMKKFKPNNQYPNAKINLSPEDRLLLDRVQNQEGIKSKFIIVSRSYTLLDPYSILQNSAVMLLMNLKVENINDQYTLKINNEIIVSGTASSEKEARMQLATQALIILRDHCFELVIGDPCQGQSAEIPEDKVEDEAIESNALPDDNIGAKMMKLMGWKGKGLGKEERGRQEPIIAEQRIDRLGLGVDKGLKNLHMQTEKCLKEYISKGGKQNLVFSGFGKGERAIIHAIATKFHLRSLSYGKEPNRRLVINKKQKPWQMVMDLLANRECHNKYLIKPRKMMEEIEAQKPVMDPLENRECPDDSLIEPDEISTKNVKARKTRKLVMDPLENRECPDDSLIEPDEMTTKNVKARKTRKLVIDPLENQEYPDDSLNKPNKMTTRKRQKLMMGPLANQECSENSFIKPNEITTKRQKLMMDPLVNQECSNDSLIEPNKKTKKKRRKKPRADKKKMDLIENQEYPNGFQTTKEDQTRKKQKLANQECHNCSRMKSK